jgi:hypothetical protein
MVNNIQYNSSKMCDTQINCFLACKQINLFSKLVVCGGGVENLVHKRVRTVIRLRDGRSGVRIRAGVRDFSVLQNVQTVSGAHPPS